MVRRVLVCCQGWYRGGPKGSERADAERRWGSAGAAVSGGDIQRHLDRLGLAAGATLAHIRSVGAKLEAKLFASLRAASIHRRSWLLIQKKLF